MSLSLLLSILLQAASGLKPADEGAVAGMLRLHGGIPASGVRVAVMAPPGAGRGEPQGAGTLVTQGQSDDSGKYRLDGVPPGRYYVVAGKLDAPTFYPGVRSGVILLREGVSHCCGHRGTRSYLDGQRR